MIAISFPDQFYETGKRLRLSLRAGPPRTGDLNIALHGLTRLPDLPGFAAGLREQFAKSFLPPSLVTTSAYGIAIWQARRLGFWPPGEAWLFPATGEVPGLPATLEAPDDQTRLRGKMELFGFTVSGHPLRLIFIPMSRGTPIARSPGWPTSRPARHRVRPHH